MPVASVVLALSLLSLAGIPPLGGFVGKTVLLGAALGGGFGWLAVVLALNVAVSLYYYVRVLEMLYLRGSGKEPLPREPRLLRMALGVLAVGALLTGLVPQPWLRLASHASNLLRHAEPPAQAAQGMPTLPP